MQAWWKLSSDMWMASLEAQHVIGLRIMKLSRGGIGAVRESNKMISEKVLASAEAAMILASGGSPEKVLRCYRSVMRANSRRLGGVDDIKR